MDAAAVKEQVAALADPDRAAVMRRFFDTGSGGDGEGDVFLGPPVPAQRRVARDARGLPLSELATLLESPVHEHRFVALVVLVERHRRGHAPERQELERFYLDHRAAVNHWDLVDVSAPDLLGTRLADHPGERGVLDELAASERVWDRRIAVLATSRSSARCAMPRVMLRYAIEKLSPERRAELTAR